MYSYKLANAHKHYNLMWEYLSQNLKADVNILVPFQVNWHCHATYFVRDLFNYGMDLITEISFWKTLVVDEKVLVLATDKGWMSARGII